MWLCDGVGGYVVVLYVTEMVVFCCQRPIGVGEMRQWLQGQVTVEFCGVGRECCWKRPQERQGRTRWNHLCGES